MHLFSPKKSKIDAVYLKYGDMLYRVALTRLGNEADAMDAVQDVFVKFLENEPAFADGEHEKAWFLRATLNRSSDMLRRQKHREYLPLEDAYAVAAEDRAGYRALMALLSRLPSIYKDVLILHALEGFSVEETAGMLDISLSAAKMRLKRGREILQILREEETDVY